MPPLNALKDIAKPQPLEMEDDYLRENLSQQELVTNGGSRSDSNSTVEDVENQRPTRDQIKLVAILCFVNLINYMDRYTVAGLLTDIEVAFDLTEGQKGLLQTAFILVYMVMAPLYGYLGDRFNRRVLMAVGVFLWSLTTLLGSFMQTYHWFLVMRCFVGIGEASYSTIAPTLISDIFVSNLRSKMLALFYFAIPVGSGLGYITGSEVADIAERFLPPAESADAWRWGLRVTPVMGLVAVLLIIFVLKEPPRGVSEGAQHLKPTSFISDIKHLVSNRTYIFTTLAFTCVTYVAGALA
ncbi:Protein spinster [Armadillidium vulgare]|nr:Protein spinster [Armadillidium vulgare]